MKDYKTILTVLCALFTFSFYGESQITYGSIEYEIRTNMDKRFPTQSNPQGNFGGRGQRMGGRNATSTAGNYITEKATLYFTDEESVFISELPEGRMDQNRTFATYTEVNFANRNIETQVNLIGELFKIEDQQKEFIWKFTSKERLIAGKYAKQAITKINDSTTIYAWFDTDFVPSIGPESYWNLPGAILGLAYEDGAITYFATKINEEYPDLNAVKQVMKAKKTYSRRDFEAEFVKKYKAGDRLYQLVKDLLHFY